MKFRMFFGSLCLNAVCFVNKETLNLNSDLKYSETSIQRTSLLSGRQTEFRMQYWIMSLEESIESDKSIQCQ